MDSERRLAAWLRQDIQAIVSRTVSGSTDVEAIAPPAPPARVAKTLDKMLTPDQLIERCRHANLTITKKTLANWRSSDKGPRSIKRGRFVFYLESEVEAWEQSQIKGTKL